MALKQDFQDFAVDIFEDPDFDGIIVDAVYQTKNQVQDPITYVVTEVYSTADIRILISDSLSFQKTIVKTLGSVGTLILLPENTNSMYDYYIAFPGRDFPFTPKAGDEIVEGAKIYAVESVISCDPAVALWIVRARRAI